MNDIVQEMNSSGVDAIFVTCDIANREDVAQVAAAVMTHFGQIDTWVNNAGVSIYGRLDEVGEEDSRRLFDINFWEPTTAAWPPFPFLRPMAAR